jgi:hypothetical protein
MHKMKQMTVKAKKETENVKKKVMFKVPLHRVNVLDVYDLYYKIINIA